MIIIKSNQLLIILLFDINCQLFDLCFIEYLFKMFHCYFYYLPEIHPFCSLLPFSISTTNLIIHLHRRLFLCVKGVFEGERFIPIINRNRITTRKKLRHVRKIAIDIIVFLFFLPVFTIAQVYHPLFFHPQILNFLLQ